MEHATNSLRVAFLGSGSSGNATAVVYGGRCVLVDCGFSAREAIRRLETCGISRESLDALLLTHEHGDHVKGAEVLARRMKLPVLATEGTLRAAGLVHLPAVRVRAGDTLAVGPFQVTVFATSHDVAEPVGFGFRAPSSRAFGIATDTGRLTGEALEVLEQCEIVGLETNHDVEMLLAGPYPAFLKRRILSDRGHLSNRDAATALQRLAEGRTRRVVAMHLSRTNNTREVALAALHRARDERELPLDLEATAQHQPLLQEVAG